MTNHPSRKRAPVDLAGALRETRHDGETWPAFAKRAGVSEGNLNKWLTRPPTGDLARLAEWALRAK